MSKATTNAAAAIIVKYVTPKPSYRVAVMTINNPPVNGLSHAVRSELVTALQRAANEKVNGCVIIGGGKTFPAGADIAEFEQGTWTQRPDLGEVVEVLDPATSNGKPLPFPVVAAIHGTALGGGLELALGCNFRVCASTSLLGVPEVQLGIMPGAQGTQRLPRVAGTAKALDMILKGAPISAKDALDAKIVDVVVNVKNENELLDKALEFVMNIPVSQQLPRISQYPAAKPLDDKAYSDAVKTNSQRGHVTGPVIVEAVKQATNPNASFTNGVSKEAELFKGLMATPEAAGLQHMFFAERTCTKIPGVDANLGANVAKVGVIGAGTMGAGIAMCFAAKNIPVVLCDADQAALARGVATMESNWKKSSAFKSGKMTEEQLKQRMSLITQSTDTDAFSGFKDVDVVIEAVFENLELKKNIFAKLDKICKPSALLCTNTSYLDIDAIANATSRPQSVMGTHFFSPANVMPLLENVRGTKTDVKAIATAMKMGKNIGKTAVLSGNAFGFIGNRMFEPYTQQAICLLEEGLIPSQVDDPLGPKGFGFAMGPLAVFDLAGNDIGYRIRREAYYPHTPQRVSGTRGKTWMALADALCEKERYGQKKGKGWYIYDPVTRRGSEDPNVLAMLNEHRSKFAIASPTPAPSSKDVVDRCVFAMVNEGFRILEDKIAVRSSDIDVVWNYGYGFPRYRGGPMHYAEKVVGLENLRNALLKYKKQQPELPAWHFTPAPLLERLVREKKELKDL